MVAIRRNEGRAEKKKVEERFILLIVCDIAIKLLGLFKSLTKSVERFHSVGIVLVFADEEPLKMGSTEPGYALQ